MVTSTIEKAKTYTLEEYTRLPDDGKSYELVKGALVEMGQPGNRHGRVGTKLLRRLGDYVEKNQLGAVYFPTGFVLDKTNPKKPTVRAPDIGFLAVNHVPSKDEDGPIPRPPDLAIEVVSPSDVWSKVDEKVDEYLTAGVPLVWVIYPPRKTVFVHKPNQPMSMLINSQAELSGEQVVPGFKITIAELFG